MFHDTNQIYGQFFHGYSGSNLSSNVTLKKSKKSWQPHAFLGGADAIFIIILKSELPLVWALRLEGGPTVQSSLKESERVINWPHYPHQQPPKHYHFLIISPPQTRLRSVGFYLFILENIPSPAEGCSCIVMTLLNSVALRNIMHMLKWIFKIEITRNCLYVENLLFNFEVETALFI